MIQKDHSPATISRWAPPIPAEPPKGETALVLAVRAVTLRVLEENAEDAEGVEWRRGGESL